MNRKVTVLAVLGIVVIALVLAIVAWLTIGGTRDEVDNLGARWTAVLAIMTGALAAATLLLGFVGAAANQQARSEADKNEKRRLTEMRAYVAVGPERLDIEKVGTTGVERAIPIVRIENVGETPALDVAIKMTTTFSEFPDSKPQSSAHIGYLAPGAAAFQHGTAEPGGILRGKVTVTGKLTFRDELVPGTQTIDFSHSYDVALADWYTDIRARVGVERADRTGNAWSGPGV